MDRTAAGEVIRPALPADEPAVLALVRAAELPEAEVRERLFDFVVAESGGAVVGAAGLEVHGVDGMLRSVVVENDHRGRGVGRRLTERVVSTARRRGLRRLYLLTTTAEDYFPRLGFRPLDRSKVEGPVLESVEFREACPATAAAMVLELNEVGAPDSEDRG